ncbi:MAG: ABC transporter permease subunit [Tumebacillaceae bacterium]
MNKTAMWAIAQKDMNAIRTNSQIWVPMIIVPLVLGVILPVVAVIVIKSMGADSINSLNKIVELIGKLPAGDLKDSFDSLPTVNHQLIYMLVNYFFVPFFLLIAVMASMMIAANSFVGEKERRTLESLLFAPIDITALFVGKVLAAFLPAMVLTLTTFILYGGLVNALTYSMFDGLLVPTWNWLTLIVWVVPMISLCTILFCTLISARVKGFQEAQQLGGVIVLPVVGLVISQATGLMFLQTSVLLIIGAVLLAANLLLLRQIAKMNQRDVLFEKQVH